MIIFIIIIIISLTLATVSIHLFYYCNICYVFLTNDIKEMTTIIIISWP